ncbi:hypothetical protein [Nocardioides zeicaulis]|uniref:Uncharacterized protein n=1 Tax=Nocardioides zeicaulis TaxID=1776857 RepID=A0ABV6DWM2_9ACTN
MSALDRRTVVRGAAWSIPVVVAVAQAPAWAASTDAPSINGNGSFTICKLAGAGQNCQGYRLTVTFAVQPDDLWDIAITALAFNDNAVVPSTAAFAVRYDDATRTFEFCSDSKSPSQFRLTFRYSATNRRTGATTPNLGGTYALSGVGNC